MTRGEIEKVTLAMYKIAKVKVAINAVEVWNAIGPDGIEKVDDLNEAIKELADVILEDAMHSIKLKEETK